ncbi:hypothetical protein AVEN_123940-1 [Araneus ventricosus]|uniref:Uncharacterized protein n=1 Tax=Araneus ventricosus TaxID=182803 RepID=A0A4Y2NG94_ARAVE|nr:hypothetical protein AVEN_123940-1 [Araneus ventricosus]
MVAPGNISFPDLRIGSLAAYLRLEWPACGDESRLCFLGPSVSDCRVEGRGCGIGSSLCRLFPCLSLSCFLRLQGRANVSPHNVHGNTVSTASFSSSSKGESSLE